MTDRFKPSPGLGYSPAAMVGGWFGSLGAAPQLRDTADRRVVLTFQGRTALCLLGSLLQLGPRDEVLLPAYNCGAEVDPFVQAGCRVVFYRVDREANADLEDIRRRITPATRIVYVTHFFGWPQDLAGLAALCAERQLLLVEDCAQALFSEEAGNAIGRYGDAVVHSFVKSLALPDGGALVLKPHLSGAIASLHFPPALVTLRTSLPLFKKWLMQHHAAWQWIPGVRRLLSRSWSSAPASRNATGRKEMLSSNRFVEARRHWGMSRVAQGLLKRANAREIVASRRRNFAYLSERLDNPGQFQPLHAQLPADVCPLVFPLYAKDPIGAREHFDRHGILIQGWPGYYPGFPWDDYPETCALKDALLGLPVHQDLNEAQLGHIAEVANQFGRTC